MQAIQMHVGGIASEILVQDGEEVKAGQVVMRLDAETTQQRFNSLQESQRLKTQQLALKEKELKQYLLLNQEEEKMLMQNLDLQKVILDRYKFLEEQGAAAELQYLKQMNIVTETAGKLSQVRVDRLRQEAYQQQQMQQLKAALEELNTKITEASVNLRYQVLRSPVDGVVFDLQPRGKGYAAQSTETVMKIVPYDTLQAKVEIPSSQIGFVKVGMPADLSIDSFPATDFGVLEGEVKSIGSDALPPSQQDNRPDYRYPATIKLNSQRLMLKGGQMLPLQVGMSLNSNIKLRKVSYLQLLLGTFQNKVDSLRQL
ncbi:HlyD family secretion protein [Synechococcus sp. M16.1]|uniref:HlyD family secretion protein n=1 Tax=Synechococcus sp. M16.1 TaxID=1442553 RepID=UPI00185FB743|nr:HlyD family efflux transporter periplasmic adaptor subunit [Synechococcus sp. M16.1]QNJ10245.1 type I secretion system ABC transporter/ HlyD family [Synechococcus sp. M16.1]